jgi:hypothetical protein
VLPRRNILHDSVSHRYPTETVRSSKLRPITPPSSCLTARKGNKIVGTAAFLGGEMIEPEQYVEQYRILLLGFDLVEDLRFAGARSSDCGERY